MRSIDKGVDNMSSSRRIKCPDCGREVLERNMRNHYRRLHPNLDPYTRIKEAERSFKKPRRIKFDVKTSPLVPIIGAIVIAVLLVIAGLLVYSTFSDGAGPPGPRDIFYAASDGAVINATYYGCGEPDRPTIFLIHDIGGNREQWSEFAKYLRDKGFNVMAPDLRGHGESTNSLEAGVHYDWREMDPEDFEEVGRDIEAGAKWIRDTDEEGEKNTDASTGAALIGVGRGGQFALNQASRMSRKDQKTLQFLSACMISPIMDTVLDLEQVAENWGDVRPIMFAGSEGDGNAVNAIDKLMERRPENGMEVMVDGSDQGVSLVKKDPVKNGILTNLDRGFSEGS